MSEINQYGVFTEPRRFDVINQKGVLVQISTARHPETTLWASGLRMVIGTFAESGEGIFVPVMAKNAKHPTQSEAMHYAIENIETRLRKLVEQSPDLARYAHKALRGMESCKQLELEI